MKPVGHRGFDVEYILVNSLPVQKGCPDIGIFALVFAEGVEQGWDAENQDGEDDEADL